MHSEVLDAIRRALAEDIGDGDITTRACISEDTRARGVFLAREDLVLAGTELLRPIYDERGGVDHLELFHEDGNALHAGDAVAEVVGSARTLLECERVALNFLQRLSGVATLARSYVEA